MDVRIFAHGRRTVIHGRRWQTFCSRLIRLDFVRNTIAVLEERAEVVASSYFDSKRERLQLNGSRKVSLEPVAVSLANKLESTEIAKRTDLQERHFGTSHLLTDLKGRTVSGGLITVTAQGVQFALTLSSTVILARLLTPRDFGLLAMTWTSIGFLHVFKEAGLSIATVQREGITHAQVSNLFWVNVAVSGLISLLVVAAAPAIAWFYREPRLLEITIVLSLMFLLAGLAVQPMAILNRQMRFKTIALIQVGSVLAGVLVGVGMAWLEYGYWSLVGMNLTTSMVALLMTWSGSRWRPQAFVRHSGTRSLIHFGASLTAGNFFYCLARSADGLLIGRLFGASSLGLYSQGVRLARTPFGASHGSHRGGIHAGIFEAAN